MPIRVTENGWPTGTNPLNGESRTDARQADVLAAIIDTVNATADDFHVTQYTLFGLRDADTTQSGLFHNFGILRSDYSPKPAYATFRDRVRRSTAEARAGAPGSRRPCRLRLDCVGSQLDRCPTRRARSTTSSTWCVEAAPDGRGRFSWTSIAHSGESASASATSSTRT